MPKAPRMRVFAGPNGSGKSTMYKQVQNTKVNGRPIDLGVYINPDEIARELAIERTLDLQSFAIIPEPFALVISGCAQD